MYERTSVNELVKLYNFLVAEAEGAAARVAFIWKAAGLYPSDLQKKKIGAVRYELAFLGLEETKETYEQIVNLYKEANRAWGRCITVRRKLMAAVRKELLVMAEEGYLRRVVELSLLLAKLAKDTTAEGLATLNTEVEVEWSSDDPITTVEINEDDLPW